MSRLTRDETAEPVSRDEILRRERGQGNIHFPCSADHVQDYWHPYPIGLYFCYMCDHTYIAGRPGGSVGNFEPSDVGTCVRISAQSHEFGFSSHHAQQVESEINSWVHTKFDFTLDEEKGRLNPSRDKN